jgi:hypothetical protein
MKPEPASAKKTFPSESPAMETGASSLPGESPFSPQVPRNSNGGGGCDFGAGVARLPQEMSKNMAINGACGNLHRNGLDFVLSIR